MIVFFLSFLSMTVNASDLASSLKVVEWGTSRDLSKENLKKLNSYQKIQLPKDPMSQDQPRSYWAVRAKDLFNSEVLKSAQSFHFKALDGMTVMLTAESLTRQGLQKSEAWLAVAPAKGPWPTTRSGKSIGPFYLVWLRPEKDHVGAEEWPFQVIEVRAEKEYTTLYPKILPKKGLANSNSISKGLQVFLKNCFPCHTLNKQGPAHFGPDLNFPNNPTEYFKKEYLIKYLRNPRTLRYWPQSKMPAFGKNKINDKELEDLLNYLSHMSQRKIQTPQ